MAPKKMNVKIEPDDDEAMEVDNKAKVKRANKVDEKAKGKKAMAVDEKAKGKMTMLKSGGLRISDETGKKVNVKIEPDDEAMEFDNKAKVKKVNVKIEPADEVMEFDNKAKVKKVNVKIEPDDEAMEFDNKAKVKKVNVKTEPDDEAMEFDNKAKVKKADDVDEMAKGKLAMAVDEKAKGKMSMLKPGGLRIGDETGKRKIKTEVTSPNKRRKTGATQEEFIPLGGLIPLPARPSKVRKAKRSRREVQPAISEEVTSPLMVAGSGTADAVIAGEPEATSEEEVESLRVFLGSTGSVRGLRSPKEAPKGRGDERG